MAENVPYKEEDIQSFIDIVDNNKDGKISKPELIDFIMNLFNSMWVIWSQCYSYSFFASFIFFIHESLVVIFCFKTDIS